MNNNQLLETRNEWKRLVKERWIKEPSNWSEENAEKFSEILAELYFDKAVADGRNPESFEEVYFLETR